MARNAIEGDRHGDFDALPVERQETIMRASIEGFGRHDYKGASTEEIARRAGMSKGLLFFYFRNKSSLYVRTLDYLMERAVDWVVDDEFRAIERDFPNFSFNLALDRPDPEADAAGEKYTPGFVHNVLYENYLKNHQAPEDCIYLMCGPPMMIASVVKMLDSLGVPSENILYDNFGS